MSVTFKHDVTTLFRHFDTRADFVSAQSFGTGHINDTYRVVASQAGHRVLFTLQHINSRVFRDADALMENIVRITTHTRRRLRVEGAADASRRGLQVIPTLEGRPCHVDGAGRVWRMYVFVDGVRTVDQVEQPRQAFEAARAFGHFQRLLADLPGSRLHETIPGFHDTRRRFNDFRQAAAEDVCGRAASAHREIDFADGLESRCDSMLRRMASGEIPERVTHNDTKINNVLMDVRTGEGLCVIDLDTCMPGSALHDFGDMVRSATNSADEDESDTSKVHCRRGIFDALARGYLEAADFLTPSERAHLVEASSLMTLECGLRFLTDYLQGDVYFKIHRDGQNLDRCRTQFALACSIDAQAGEMQQLVDTL